MSSFNLNLPLKILVHGFSSSIGAEWLHEMKNNLMANDEVNVIITGWGEGAKFPLYYTAAANTRIVGKQISLIVDKIQQAFYNKTKHVLNVHCIGHSLGAQVFYYIKLMNIFNIYYD